MAKTINKWKNKNWYPVEAPEMFEKKEIGDTPALTEEDLIERTVETSLRDITGKRSHNNIRIKFQIKEVEGGTGKAQVKSFNVTRGYIRKNIRKGRSIIKNTQTIEMNSKTLKVTTYAFTVSEVHSSQKKEIRRVMEKELQKQAEENDFNPLIQKMIFGKTATSLFKKAKEIAPIKRVEITKCEVERGE